MTPEVAKLAYRAVIDYLGGNFEEYKRLTRMAMKHNDEMTCNHCGGLQVPCKVGTKGNMKKGYLCTDCGRVIIGGQLYRRLINPKGRAAM